MTLYKLASNISKYIKVFLAFFLEILKIVFLCMRKSSDKHLTIGHQPSSIQNWAEDLISGNTTTGRILVVFAFVCSIVSFVIYIIGKLFLKY